MKSDYIGHHFVEAVNAGGLSAFWAIILFPVWFVQEICQLLLLGIETQLGSR